MSVNQIDINADNKRLLQTYTGIVNSDLKIIHLPKHKCGLYLTHNEHKDYYEKVETHIDNEKIDEEDWATPTSKQRCIETNELWKIQWYPNTPIGFCVKYGATLEELLISTHEYGTNRSTKNN